MEFNWENTAPEAITLKKFLYNHGISHRMFSDLKKHKKSLLIDHKSSASNQLVLPQSTVTIKLPKEKPDPNIKISKKPIDVVYEDNNWLIINKPAGLTSVPGPSNREDTLVNRIKGYLQKNNEADLKPHLVTRLDRFTSGLVLVGKNKLANSLIDRQLRDHKVQKEYIALVAGKFDKDVSHGVIDKPIGRRDDEIQRQVLKTGKPSVTEYWVAQTPIKANFTKLRVKLHTGRTHQIRVHLTSIKHPLVGDELYQGPMDTSLQRQGLHAYKLAFIDPFTKKSLNFSAPLPNDMQTVLRGD